MKLAEYLWHAQTSLQEVSRPVGEWSVDSPDVFLPGGYEPNYAYPLLVWLESAESRCVDFHDRMEGISDRNYVGLRYPIRSDYRLDQQLAGLPEAVRQVSSFVNLHSERIFLCGVGPWAETAVTQVLSAPRMYGGFVAIQPQELPTVLPVNAYRHWRHLRGLLLTSALTPQARHLARVLHAAGTDIRQQPCDMADSNSTHRLINGFLMQGILREHY